MIAKRSVAASESGKRALPELHRVHRRDRKTERLQLVGGLADGDRAVLQPFEERALRLQRNAVDLIEQDDLARGERTELGHELAGGRVDHLKADDLGRLQVGAALEAGELRVADRGQDDAEKRLPDARDAAQQQVAGIDLPLLILVIRGRNLREQDNVRERLLGVVADQGIARFRDDFPVQIDRLLQLRVHDPRIIPRHLETGSMRREP